jgi:UDP-N-acetylmuramyl pentapeptide phosphotransferase/UDP-N-acetylglucosamine-1-phosphate transferase
VIFLSTLLLSIFLTIGLIQVLQALASRMNLLDSPGARKVHRQPIPRVGGIAMAVGAFVPVALRQFAAPSTRCARYVRKPLPGVMSISCGRVALTCYGWFHSMKK